MTKIEKLDLEHLTVARLSHTRALPGEWIGKLDDGRTIYIVATGTLLRITTGNDLNEALQKAKEDKVHTVRSSNYKTRAVSTDEMLKITGLKLNHGVGVREHPLDS